MKRAHLVLALSAAFLAPIVGPAEDKKLVRPADIPVESFFSPPDFSSLEISPDGKRLAFLTELASGKVGVGLMDLATGKIEPLVGGKDENASFLFWKGNDRVVYGGDYEGNESDSLRSFSISKRHVTPLTQSRGDGASVVSTLPYDPEHILVYSGGYAIVNVETGSRWIFDDIVGPNGMGQGSVVGRTGTILARVRDEGEVVTFEVRPDSKSRFKQVAQFNGTDAGWSFLRMDGSDKLVYVLTNDTTDTPELHSINVATGQLSPALFRPESGEIRTIIQSEDGMNLYGVLYEDDRFHYHWFDQSRAKLQAQIDASLPETFNRVVSASADEQLLIIAATSDRDPGTYYILDRRVPRLMPLFRVRSKIDPKLMRPMEPIQFTARDGLVIHGYLTRPANHVDTPGPLIIHPHGGPFGLRDSLWFDPEVQFLASRGYTVLQVNYRGSGGYGTKFEQAGWKEWGGKMQDDLTDAVKWAIDQKITVPDRVAIYGASYGGYAALAGVTFTPDLYQCAINYVGVTDLKIFKRYKYLGSSESEVYVNERIGSDPEYVRTHSPVNFVDRIKVPTLHIYGYNDPRVDIVHWKRLRAKLVEYNKPFEEIVKQDEGHGFDNKESEIAVYKRMEAFLAKNLPADN